MLRIKDPYLISFVIFLTTLWDYYFVGLGRFFDYLAVIFILFFLFKQKTFFLSNILYTFLLILSVLYPIVNSILEGEFLFPIAFFVFLVISNFFISGIKNLKNLDIGLIFSYLLWIHISFFFIQFLFMLTGNFFAFFPDVPFLVTPRNLFHTRCSGLFLEPNEYCFLICLLLSIRNFVTNKWFDLLSLFSVLSMILSLSLSGVILGVAYFIFASKNTIYSIVLKSIIILLGIYFYNKILVNSSEFIDTFLGYPLFGRVTEVQSQNDISLNARYGIQKGFSDISVFGERFDLSHIAINEEGLSFYYFGLFYSGLIFLVVFFCPFLIIALRKFDTKIIWVVAVIILGYPHVSYLFFWIFIFSILNYTKLKPLEA